MIEVHTMDDATPFEDATRYSTDEHNNLCIWGGANADLLMAVFAAGYWQRAEVDLADQS